MVDENGIDYEVEAVLCRACEAREIQSRDMAEEYQGRGMAGLYLMPKEVVSRG